MITNTCLRSSKRSPPSVASGEATVIRVVVDLNIVVSALLGSSSCRAVVLAIERELVTPVASVRLLNELREVLGRPRFQAAISVAAIHETLAILEDNALLVAPRHRISVARDPDDDHLLEIALEASADAIVTGDKDLLVLDPFKGIPILAPRKFLAWLAAR